LALFALAGMAVPGPAAADWVKNGYRALSATAGLASIADATARGRRCAAAREEPSCPGCSIGAAGTHPELPRFAMGV
jgi:hypothetical protein